MELGSTKANIIGTTVEDEPVSAGHRSGLAAAFNGPEDFTGGGFEAEEGITGGVE